jgi:NDP-sugar pyrophosphorylase family protein
MLKLHGKPFLEYILEGLIFAGFREFIFVVGYRKEQIISYFQSGKNWNVNIEYFEQEKLNGTGGALLLCENSIYYDHFFLTWGDILVPYKIYKDLVDIHQKEKYDYLLVANYTDDPYLGAAIYSEGNICTNIIEKPPIGTSKTNLNNCGVFIFSKNIFNVLRNLSPSVRGEIELPKALLKGIKELKWKVRVVEMGENQFRIDLGVKQIYEQLRDDSSWLHFLKI